MTPCGITVSDPLLVLEQVVNNMVQIPLTQSEPMRLAPTSHNVPMDSDYNMLCQTLVNIIGSTSHRSEAGGVN